MDKNYPDITAVDPQGCGCTECLIHEYVPQEIWFGNANAADVMAFLTGEVRNNTYTNSVTRFLWENDYAFNDRSAKVFLSLYFEKMYEAMDEMAQGNLAIIDLEPLLADAAWQ